MRSESDITRTHVKKFAMAERPLARGQYVPLESTKNVRKRWRMRQICSADQKRLTRGEVDNHQSEIQQIHGQHSIGIRCTYACRAEIGFRCGFFTMPSWVINATKNIRARVLNPGLGVAW